LDAVKADFPEGKGRKPGEKKGRSGSGGFSGLGEKCTFGFDPPKSASLKRKDDLWPGLR
jgi:hypothetical protein